MSKKNTFAETFRQRMIAAGKVIYLPKDSPLREILGLDEEVEQTKTEEE